MEVKGLEHLIDLSQMKMTLPDELPPPVQRDKFPADLLRSSTIENLISQNEELMSRLKVTLRRLDNLETENQKLAEVARKEQLRSATLNEQFMVMREKDRMWKKKVDELEQIKENLQEKYLTLQNLYKQSQTQVERHQKYHDRIRNHVKPFVQELKRYSKALEKRLQEGQGQLDQKEAQIADLRHQIIEISKNSKYQIDVLEEKLLSTTDSYERGYQQMFQQVEDVTALNKDLAQKAERLRLFQERADHLENENIEIRRRLEKSNERHQFNMEAAQEQIKTRTREFSRLSVEHQDAVGKLLEEVETRKSLEKEILDLRHQLDSLRFMWTSKNEENEKLQQGLRALEQLNIELSAKLQEIRSTEGSVSAPSVWASGN